MRTPSQYLHAHLGAPALSDCEQAPPGAKCWVCAGAVERGTSRHQWQNALFTGQNRCKAQGSDWVCEACVYIHSRTAPVPGRLPGPCSKCKGKNAEACAKCGGTGRNSAGGNFRNYSHLFEQLDDGTVLYLLLSERQQAILDIFAEAQRRYPRRAGAAGQFFVTPHAIERWMERVGPENTYEAALGACIHLSDKATKIGPAAPDPDTGEARDLWEGRDAHGRAVRFIVGYRAHPGIDSALPQMVTILPLDAVPTIVDAPPPERDAWVLSDVATSVLASAWGIPIGQARAEALRDLVAARFEGRQEGVERWRGARAIFEVVALDDVGEVRGAMAA